MVIVPLVARSAGLCVHEKISKIKNAQQLNEKCQDLCDKGANGCPHRDEDFLELLEDHIE